MMKYEFEELAGYEVSFEDYTKLIEPMYIAADIDKKDFVKLLNKERFALKKSEAQRRAEYNDLIDKMLLLMYGGDYE